MTVSAAKPVSISRFKFHLWPFLSFVALILLINWPLVLKINTHVIGRSFEDAFEVLWQLAWMERALFQTPVNPFYSPDIFYPSGWYIASGAQPAWFMLLFAPLSAVIGSVFTYNFVLLSTFVVAGFGVYLYAFNLTGQRLAAFAAGCVYVAAPVLTVRMGGHIHTLLSMAFLPYAMLAFSQTFHADKWHTRWIVFAAVALALTILASWYFLFIATLPLLAFPLFASSNASWIERGRRLLAVGGITLLCIAPFVYLTWIARQAMFPASGEFALASSDVLGLSFDYLFAPNLNHPIWGDWSVRHFPVRGEQNAVSIGYTALVLAIVGVVSTRRGQTRPILAMLGISLLLAMGLTLQWNGDRLLLSAPLPVASLLQRLYASIPLSPDQVAIPLPGLFLYHWLPFYAAMRAWARFAIPLMLALSILSGLGAAYLARKGGAWRYLLLAATALVVFEGLTVPYRAFTAVAQNQRSANEWLAQLPAGATLIEYPRPIVDKIAMYSQSLHGQRLVNGYMSIEPSFLQSVSAQLGTWPNAAALPILEEWGVQYVVVNGGSGPAFQAETLPQIEALDRLCRVAIFDDGFMYFDRTYIFKIVPAGGGC